MMIEWIGKESTLQMIPVRHSEWLIVHMGGFKVRSAMRFRDHDLSVASLGKRNSNTIAIAG